MYKSVNFGFHSQPREDFLLAARPAKGAVPERVGDPPRLRLSEPGQDPGVVIISRRAGMGSAVARSSEFITFSNSSRSLSCHILWLFNIENTSYCGLEFSHAPLGSRL